MIDLWTLLVVDIFGSFWLAVLGLCALMWIIFVMGKVSTLTTFNFLSIFVLSMALGYGYMLYGMLLYMLIIAMHILVIPRTLNS